MTTWWLIRHGETDFNLNGRFQGSSDEPLNATGQAQATSLASRLEKMNFDAIYASDLERVRQTAHFALNGKTDSIVYDARLREIDFGKWEGLKWEEIRAQYPQEFAIWSEDNEQNPHGGERISDIALRVETFINELREQYHADEQILIFAHGGTLAIMLALLFETNTSKWWQFRIQNCTLNEVIFFRQGFVLNRLNDNQHIINS
jgi:alpha-ribazole phosphatase